MEEEDLVIGKLIMSSSIHPVAPLLRILQDKILPLLESSSCGNVVVTRASREEMILPPTVMMLPLERRGKRVAVRSAPVFARAAQLAARWPQAGMQELRIPKMAFVISGKAAIRAGDYILQCPAGTLLFLPQGVPHTDSTYSHLETLPPEIDQCSLLHFTPMISGLACRTCHTDRQKHYPSRPGEKVFLHRPQILQLFYMLAEEIGQEPQKLSPAGERVSNAFLSTLMHSIMRDLLEQQFLLQEIAAEENTQSMLAASSIEKAVAYINVHYAGPLSLEEVARRFFFSRAQFTRKFRQHTGQSFLEYLNARRIEQARKLLAETDWTAAMITRYVGFSSPAYFHRLFLRETGMTPIQYREDKR